MQTHSECGLGEAATHPERIHATVAYKPSSVVWMGLYRNPQDNLKGPRSSWTLDGEPLPFLCGRLTLDRAKMAAGRPAALRSSYAAALRDSASAAQVPIPVERIQGPVLLISGADDQMWPSAETGQMIVARLDEHGAPFHYEHLVYEDVGHGISFPFVPTTQLNSGPILSGGSAEQPHVIHVRYRSSPGLQPRPVLLIRLPVGPINTIIRYRLSLVCGRALAACHRAHAHAVTRSVAG